MKTPIIEAHRIPSEEEDIAELTELLRKAELASEEADSKAIETKRKADKLRSELLGATSRTYKARTVCGSSRIESLWISTGLLDSTKRKYIYIRDRVSIRKYNKGEFAGQSEGIVVGTTEKGDQLKIGFEDTTTTTARQLQTCTIIGRSF